MNVRVYVYNPVLGDDETITALIVWDTLTPEEAGGVVNHYNVSIQEVGTDEKIVVSIHMHQVLYIRFYVLTPSFASCKGLATFSIGILFVFCLYHYRSFFCQLYLSNY